MENRPDHLEDEDLIIFEDIYDVDDIFEVVVADIGTQVAEPARTKKSGLKKKSDANRLPCPDCNRTYANEKTLSTHRKTHILKAAASRVPDLSTLRRGMPLLCESACSSLSAELTVGDLAILTATYADNLKKEFIEANGEDEQVEQFFDFMSREVSSLLEMEKVSNFSALRSVFNSTFNKLSNDHHFRNTFYDMCNLICNANSDVLFFFMGNFMLNLCDKMLIYVSKKMRSAQPIQALPVAEPRRVRQKRSKDDVNSLTFKQVVHYIGGSVVAGILRAEKRSKSHPHPVSFGGVLRSNFLEDSLNPHLACEPEVKRWTKSLDRGGLIYITKDAFRLFYELIVFILNFEEEDGTINVEDVVKNVGDCNNTLCLWDDLVGPLTEEMQSLDWLTAIVEVLCRVVSKGVLKRRINEATTLAYTSITLRHKVAPKKS